MTPAGGRGRIAFIQPFGIEAPGGGSRILRSLLKYSPVEVVSIVSSPRQPAAPSTVTEIHLPYRPYFRRAEHTRFGHYFDTVNAPLLPYYVSRLTARCRPLNLSGIHSVAHWWDSPAAFEAAKQLKTPFFLSVHDDVRYTAMGDSRLAKRLAPLWQNASARFAISSELGEEYNARYGSRPFTLVTDGVESCAEAPRSAPADKPRIYFMGLFHLSYIRNFQDIFAVAQSLTLRCGTIPNLRFPAGLAVRVLPFTNSDEDLAADIKESDLLYLPLPFESQYAPFSNFSLSTKLVTYLSTGVPILYHGPANTVAARLLSSHNAAILVTEPGTLALQSGLSRYAEAGQNAAANALALARSQFQLAEIASRFWTPILESLPA